MSRLAFLLLLVSPFFAFAEEKKPAGFLDVLKKDQQVTLSAFKDGYYEILILKNVDVPLPYKVTEVGKDYVVLEDFLGLKEVRISVYRIKSITIQKIPK
jgi:hypothetical protein